MSMLVATILLAQLQCAPNASGSVDCWDVAKGGAPVLQVETNLLGAYDVRREDGTVERCENEKGVQLCLWAPIDMLRPRTSAIPTTRAKRTARATRPSGSAVSRRSTRRAAAATRASLNGSALIPPATQVSSGPGRRSGYDRFTAATTWRLPRSSATG